MVLKNKQTGIPIVNEKIKTGEEGLKSVEDFT